MENKIVKQKSTLIRDALALFVITLISGLALSYVYEITKAPIAEQQELKTLKANQEVFSEATSFEVEEELTSLAGVTNLESISADYAGATIVSISKAYNSSQEALGYNMTIATSAGYSDGLSIVIGYSLDGLIRGVEILSISETAGLGMKAKEPEFLDQYIDKTVNKYVVTKTGATSDDQIDAISGATITSKAVTNAINAGIAFLKENATDLGGGQE